MMGGFDWRTAVVRIPDSDPVAVMRVPDAGASGIVVPQVLTVTQAEQILRAARCFDGKNHGNRGACPSGRATGHLVPDWKEYTIRSNREVFVALGFECAEAINNIDGQIQPVAATHSLNISAGVCTPSVLRGLSFNCLAIALS